MEKSYISNNRKAYDSTAEEFQEKKDIRHQGTLDLVDAFLDRVADSYGQEKVEILELGPGSGYAAKLMSERGHTVTAIEFSEPMAQLAQRTAPEVTMIVDEFMAHDFGAQTFHAILGVAFIHLFPAADAPAVVQKMKSLLKEDGVLHLSTTKHDTTEEGYKEKTNFKSKEKRFRRQYNKDALLKLLEDNGFRIDQYHEVSDREVDGKIWMNVTAKRED